MKNNILLEEAQALLLDLVELPGEYQVPLAEAWGKVLSQDIIAPHNIPPFRKSALDGYAFRAADTRGAQPANPVKLQIIEEVRAGYMPRQTVTSGTAVKILTGAPIPREADAVSKYEDVQISGNYVFISRTSKSGDNVIAAGEDAAQGELIASKGTLITPPLVGLFAGLGMKEIPVFLPVKAAILSTGDELVDPSEELPPGKIYNSNFWSLAARCRELGTQPIGLGIVADEIEDIADRLKRGLAEADIVITTGGVSVGDYDVIKDTLMHLGAEIVFWKVAMKPGSPIVAAVKDNKLIIGLSGNPAAAMVTFDLIVTPIIKKMMGLRKPLPPKIEGIFIDSFMKPSPQRRLLRAKLNQEDKNNYVHLTGNQGNGVMKSMIDCNVLVDIPAGSGPVLLGQKITGFLIGDIDETDQREPRSIIA